VGDGGEAAAAAYLVEQGYRIIQQGFATRGGELDLIAEKGEWLVFVEVRLRTGGAIDPIETITGPKQRKVVRTAMAYVARNGIVGRAIRFDVITLWNGVLRHIPAAFDAGM
jgi:putative endonuclease